MSFNAGSVQGKLELDAGNFLSALQRAKKSLDLLDKSNRKSVGGMQKFRNALGMVRDAVIVLPAAFRAITAPFRKFLGFLKESSNAAAQFQVTVRKFSTALQLSGQQGVQSITDRVKGFADAFQDLTGIANTTTLNVAQTLTVLGVQEDQLESATTAVLNYSEAMGRDATMAALQFGRTLSGLIGELGEALPAVRDLTQAQLQQGEAFKVAGRLFKGTAEAIADTTEGLKRGLRSAFGDLQRAVGDAMNPVVDAVLKGMKSAVEAMTRTVNDSRPWIQDAFESVARGIIQALRTVSEFGLDFPAMLADAKAFMSTVVGSFMSGGAKVEVIVLRTLQRIKLLVADIFMSLSGLPVIGNDMAAAADKLLGEVSEMGAQVREAQKDAKAMEATMLEQVAAAEAAAQAARNQAEAIRDGTDSTSAMAIAYNTVNDALDETEGHLDTIAAREKERLRDFERSRAGFNARLKHLREMTGITGEAKSRTELLNNAVEAARGNTEGLADAAGRAADGFRDAAGAAASVGSAAGGAASAWSGTKEDTGSLLGEGFGRSKGGSAGLDLTTIGGATAALAAARTAGRASVGGLYSHAARKSAHIVAQQIEGKLQGLTDQAFADFTAELIQELNRAGILDPTERSKIIRDRTAEAQRFGILPTERNVSARIGAVM